MALALEGTPKHVTDNSLQNLAFPAFTTSQAAQLFIISQKNSGQISSISGGSLTWSLRKHNGGGNGIEIWTAKATGAISAETYTLNFTNTGFSSSDLFAFSGNDTTPGFDGNASIPASSAGAGSDPLNATTDNANDVLISGFRMANTSTPTQGTGWTKISGANFTLSQYKIVSASGSQSATIGTGVGDANGGVLDALKEAAAAGVTYPQLERFGHRGAFRGMLN